jgi:hypothetical protein
MVGYKKLAITDKFCQQCNYMNPASVYANGTTYVCSDERSAANIIITAYNHTTEEWHDVVTVATDNAAGIDIGRPCMNVDKDGYIHVFYSCGNTAPKYKRSVNPYDITSWATKTPPSDITSCNEPNILVDSVGNLYFICQHNVSSRRVVRIRKSTDGGDTWSNPISGELADFSGTIFLWNSYCWMDSNDKIHILWEKDAGDEALVDVYYIVGESGGTIWKKADGTVITTPANATTSDKVYDSSGAATRGAHLRLLPNGNPIILFTVHGLSGNMEWHTASWTGSTWSIKAITAAGNSGNGSEGWGKIDVVDATTYTVILDYATPFQVLIFKTLDSGDTWSLDETVYSGAHQGWGLMDVINYTTIKYTWGEIYSSSEGFLCVYEIEEVGENMAGYLVLVGDTNWLYIAGGGTNENIIKKVDGSGDMGVNSTHTLTNGRKIRGIVQSGDYIYVTCLQDGTGASSPRVIKIAKSDWTETVKILSTIGGDSADSVGPISVDGTDLRIGGSVATAKSAFWTIAIADFSTITASYKYTIFQDNRVYEDLKGFTETDPATWIDIIHHNYLDFNANTSQDARVTKDYTADHFGNFTHKFKFCIDSSAEGAVAYPYLLAKDTLDDAKGLHDGSKIFIGVRVTQDGASSYKLYLHEDNGGSAYEDTALTIALTTFYFCRLVKSTTTLTLDVYSSQALLDAGASGDLGTKTLTLHANHTFRYLYAGDTYNDGSNKTCDLDIENLAIGEVTTPGQIETFYLDDTYIYAFTTNGMCYKITKADLTLSTSNYLIPTGSSHTPKMECFFYAGSKPWNDLFWVTGCTFKHLLKLRMGAFGFEKELADSDTDWTSFGCAIGSGDYLYVGGGNINEIKKVDISTLSVSSTLALSTGTTGINALWSN